MSPNKAFHGCRFPACAICTRWLLEQKMLKRGIKSTDRPIDKLVYALYGLSVDEFKIVEGRE